MAAWLSSLAPCSVRAEEPGGRAALWQPQKPTPLAVKIHSAELTYEPAAHAFAVTSRTELVLPEDAPAAAVSATLAIVEHPCDDSSELDESCDPQRLTFPALSASVGERAQALERSRGAGAGQPPAWLMPVRVKKGEPLSLEQRYRVPAVEAAERGYGVAYLLRGVSAWSKPLGRSTLKLNLPAYTCLVVEPQELPRKSRRVVMREDALWLELVYEAYQYLPKRDFELYFEPCVVPRDTALEGCSVSALLGRKFYAPEEGEEVEPISDEALGAALAPLPLGELEACRDGVFKAYAALYTEEELRRLPPHPQAGRNYTAPLLSAADWDWVRYLEARIAERKAALPVEPQPVGEKKIEPPAADGGCGCQLRAGAAPGAAWGVLAALGALSLHLRLRHRVRSKTAGRRSSSS